MATRRGAAHSNPKSPLAAGCLLMLLALSCYLRNVQAAASGADVGAGQAVQHVAAAATTATAAQAQPQLSSPAATGDLPARLTATSSSNSQNDDDAGSWYDGSPGDAVAYSHLLVATEAAPLASVEDFGDLVKGSSKAGQPIPGRFIVMLAPNATTAQALTG